MMSQQHLRSQVIIMWLNSSISAVRCLRKQCIIFFPRTVKSGTFQSVNASWLWIKMCYVRYAKLPVFYLYIPLHSKKSWPWRSHLSPLGVSQDSHSYSSLIIIAGTHKFNLALLQQKNENCCGIKESEQQQHHPLVQIPVQKHLPAKGAADRTV